MATAGTSVIVHSENKEIIKELDLAFLLLGKRQKWNDENEVVIALVENDQSIENALIEYTGLGTERFKRHWNRIAFTGRGQPPRKFKTAKELVAFVNANKGAIGLVKESKYLPGVRVLKLAKH